MPPRFTRWSTRASRGSSLTGGDDALPTHILCRGGEGGTRTQTQDTGGGWKCVIRELTASVDCRGRAGRAATGRAPAAKHYYHLHTGKRDAQYRSFKGMVCVKLASKNGADNPLLQRRPSSQLTSGGRHPDTMRHSGVFPATSESFRASSNMTRDPKLCPNRANGLSSSPIEVRAWSRGAHIYKYWQLCDTKQKLFRPQAAVLGGEQRARGGVDRKLLASPCVCLSSPTCPLPAPSSVRYRLNPRRFLP